MTHRNTPAYAVPFPLATPGIVDERLPYNVRQVGCYLDHALYTRFAPKYANICMYTYIDLDAFAFLLDLMANTASIDVT
jgi:hypothetical protein